MSYQPNITVPSYLTLGTSAAVANERVATAGAGIAINDAGAGSTATFTHQWTGSAKTSSFTADYGFFYYVDSSGGAVVVTLPTAVGFSGKEIIVSLQTAGNAMSFNTTSSQTIDGIASTALSTTVRYNSYRFISNGTNWVMN